MGNPYFLLSLSEHFPNLLPAMYEFRTDNSRFLTDGTRWLAWDWIHTKSKESLPIISPDKENERPFGSGNFLMFPWVNRHASKVLSFHGKPLDFQGLERDENGFPVHGLVHSLERKALKVRSDGRGAEFRIVFPEEWKDSPLSHIAVREEYTLDETSAGTLLTLRTKFNNLKSETIRFAYGYHPYFSLQDDPATWSLHLHLDKNLELNEELVPVQPTIANSVESILPDEKIRNLDHLFYGKDPRVVLENSKRKYSITVMSPPPEEGQISLEYYQIYTKPDFSSIAVEPCSAPGNALVSGSGLTELKGHSEAWGEWRILVKAL